ncbi:hypothetical protein BDV95DRAFT_560695 [Massariosphaeria phaeospora]|uniref:RING-type domain-containing protein n=1 Tax=Massariosphaeria phaeospora TaxID=100035 RepID=A0A7C8IHE8_9PLEO|nr:hypothetical protein BDV95DRAFT_560695 [Massariosphaeria phaeospora]
MRQLRSCGHRLCGECLTALIESGHERSHCCPFDRLRMFEDAKEELEQMEEFERTMDALSESAWMVILPRSPYEAP